MNVCDKDKGCLVDEKGEGHVIRYPFNWHTKAGVIIEIDHTTYINFVKPVKLALNLDKYDYVVSVKEV